MKGRDFSVKCIQGLFFYITLSHSLKAVFYTDMTFSRIKIDIKTFLEVLVDARTLFVPTKNSNAYVTLSEDGAEKLPKAIFLGRNDIGIDENTLDLSTTEPFVYLGQNSNGVNYVGVEITKLNQSPSRLKDACVRCDSLRNFADTMNVTEASLLAYATGMAIFHSSNSFCSRCGSATKSQKCGASRKCSNADCRASSYPRIEPAAIMLVTSICGKYCVLGRKSTWPVGRYSALAGFLEVGETLEQAFIRETLEESGIEVDPASVQYVASQPWPFPSSLMVGFRGIARHPTQRSTVLGLHPESDGDESAVTDASTGIDERGEGIALPPITFDTDEMQDVRWFSKLQVRAGLLLQGSTALANWEPVADEQILHFPGRSSMARLLLEEWSRED